MKIGIYGYGNLGKGAELATLSSKDGELIGIFSRRAKKQGITENGAKIFPANDVYKYQKDIDVLLICGGSSSDLPSMTPTLAEYFNVIDSFDNHACIGEHFARVDAVAKKRKKLALISCGWDPGLLSLCRLYSEAVLPQGQSHTFWGRGVSQGHSEAIRAIDGVIDARQYTVPLQNALELAKSQENVILSDRTKHFRECYVVAEAQADKAEIERKIKNMPNYFAEYDTAVHFVSEEELKAEHSELSHGGYFIRQGRSGNSKEHKQKLEFSLTLASNPEFTADVLVAFARAVQKMHGEGKVGCITVFDVAPTYLSDLTYREQIEKYL